MPSQPTFVIDTERMNRARGAFAAAQERHQAGDLAEAEHHYRQSLAADPSFLDALQGLGVIAYQTGHLPEATDIFSRLIAADGTNPSFHSNLGIMLQEQGKLEPAAIAFANALKLKPDFAEVHYNLGNVQHQLGRLPEAEAAYRRAVTLMTGFYVAHGNLGNVLQAQGRYEEAQAAYERAIALKSDHAESHYNLGVTLQVQGKPAAAAASYRRALAYDPGLYVAHDGLGSSLSALGRQDDAIAAYNTVLATHPDFASARSNRLLALNYRPELSAEAVLAEHRAWDEHHGGAAAPEPHANDKDPERPIRVGYVSADFRTHPGGYFITGVLGAHDRSAVETYCYAANYDEDAMTAAMKGAAGHWRSIAGMSDEDAAALIRQDGIDLLVDLSGHTAGARLALFAKKPAPVQASWLGYVATTGLKAMDYLIMDSASAPEGFDASASEALARLPEGRFCYTPPAYAPDPAPPPSLANGYPTFGSFNNLAKIGPATIALWAEVLKAVPEARLILKWAAYGEEETRRAVTDAFRARGVAPERLEFRGFSAHADMLAEYADIDVALDPIPFNGGLTTAEALWMGVPVVALAGDRPASRQSLSMLETIGMGELVAKTPPDYVARAAGLARDTARLSALRQETRGRMKASALCDAARFTRSLEAAYREMWRRWTRGEAPARFELGASS